MTRSATVLCLLVGSLPASAQSLPCQESPLRVGECRVVHGRFSYWNGSPAGRIWVIGTNRILGVNDWDADLPEYLGANVWSTDKLYGDFHVCPFEVQKAGEMQMVCIQSWANVVRERTGDGKRTLRRIPPGPSPMPSPAQ